MAQAAGATWLDGGHNPHAAAAQAQTLAAMSARDGRPAVLIAGLLSNKDAEGFFAAYAELKPRVIAVPFDAEAASPPERIVDAARAAGLEAEIAPDLKTATARALESAGRLRHICCRSTWRRGAAMARRPAA